MSITDLKVAILIANGFEQSEMLKPKQALEDAGATVHIVSPEKEKVKSWTKNNWGEEFSVDVQLEDAKPENYDALVLPGGVINPDKLRVNEKAIQFIKYFIDNNKPIASICHGPWTLINANGVKNHKMTSWLSLKVDLTNAGATWVDEEVVVDGKLITSRKPEDLPAFNKKILEVFSQR